MKPIFSNEDRKRTVANFVEALYQGKAKITNYSPITLYLNEKSFKILLDLKPSTIETNRYGGEPKKIYFSDVAEIYFTWLISVVTGTIKMSDDVVEEANNQLYHFIYILRKEEYLTINDNVSLVAPYQWEGRITTLEKKLDDLIGLLEKRDEGFIEILQGIRGWMADYGPTLDTAKDYFQKQLDKVKRDNG